MASAAAMAGGLIDVQLVYVGSDDYLVDFRKPNPGSEQLIFVENPIAVFGDLEIGKAMSLFEQCNYAGAKEKLVRLKDTVPEPDVRQQLDFAYMLAASYEAWDSLDFIRANDAMSRLNQSMLRDSRTHQTFLLMDLRERFVKQGKLLDDLSSALQAHGMTLQDDCVRTWLFVQNIDVNYKGVVDGRNSVFDRHGLTCDTHFISSTGIEGRTLNHANKVMLDAVAVKGIGVEQQYLYGASHLNRTSEYGVRFERGTVVRYPDFKHVFISGTASIDNKGQVMYPGDIVRQTGRMIENVEVLLAESGCSFNDVPAITVYLRDPSDYAVVKQILAERFPEHPLIVTLAPVCRPGWLIEMECVAISC